MLSLKEIIHANIEPSALNPEKLKNQEDLLAKVNKIRAKWNKPMTVTSGVRTLKDHLRIYAQKGITDQSKIPMKSKHLETVTNAAAVDIADPNKELQKWCKENEAFLEEVGLWMEDFSATPNWVHFQNIPPKSGKRWFMP
jgi:DNA repair ATPase RecN